MINNLTNSLTLKQLQTIIAVFESRQLNIAAKKLYLTPAAVSLQIKQIEENANITLFHRNKNSLTLTEFGEVYLQTAQDIQGALHKLSVKVNNIKNNDTNSLRFGVTITGEYLASNITKAYCRKFPEINFSLTVGNRTELFNKLETHELDVIIAGRPPKEFATRSIVLCNHPLLIVAHSNHPLAKEKNIPKKLLNNQHFFVREMGSGLRATLDFFLSDLIINSIHSFNELQSNEAIKHSVLSGLGIALISGYNVAAELEKKQLTALNVEGTPIIKQWFIISRVDKFKKQIIHNFENFILDNKTLLTDKL